MYHQLSVGSPLRLAVAVLRMLPECIRNIYPAHMRQAAALCSSILARPFADDGSGGGRRRFLADVLFGCLRCSDVPCDVFLSGS